MTGIQFLELTELIVHESQFDTEGKTEVYAVGDKADADIIGESKDTVDLQFGDGSVAFNVPRKAFKTIKLL